MDQTAYAMYSTVGSVQSLNILRLQSIFSSLNPKLLAQGNIALE